MKRLLFALMLICALISSKQLMAQREENFDLQSFIESLFNIQDESLNYEDLYERLLLLYENPVNLNSASVDQLKGLYIMSDSQIDSLKSYINHNGKLLTVYELQLVPGFDYNTIEKLIPFVSVNSNELTQDNRPLMKRILNERNNYFIYRFEQVLEEKKGYSEPEAPDDTRYAGGPAKHYFRYRVSKPGDFSFGLTTELDAGEKLIWDPSTKRYGMDFWSVHGMVENYKGFRKIIVGDYQLQFGQGLIFGAGFGVGKGSETINALERVNTGAKPYTSVIEGGFLRGAAITYDITDKLEVTAFGSYLKQDASINQNDETFEEYFSSIQTSGFHRTPSEIANKRQIAESVVGANLHLKLSEIAQFGMVINSNNYSLPIQRSNQAYNQFEFSGKSNYNASLYTNFSLKQFRFFSEAGISKSGGAGGVLGFTSTLSPRVEFAMIFRNYARDFHALRGASFAEGSRNINERGIYWGFKYTFNRKFFLTAYYDTFQFPWLRFRVNTPSEGSDYLLRLNYMPSSTVKMYVQFRNKTREENTEDPTDGGTIVRAGTKRQVLANFEYRVNTQLTLKSRAQLSDFKILDEFNDGYAFIQDAIYTTGKFVFSGRIAIFDTEGANNRQYAYERDVLYSFSIPAYSGEGIRNYLLIQYKVNRKIDVWARIART
ncbi:MAG: helix-hairpin-helix domain-containing protein, partial [Cytophagia bacterium]|nr:helix-hairpin-helix domain-containing protein [Cytophagia bacterium]